MKNNQRDKLWTKDFTVLWQSQLVSTMGDAVYSIALGFWILEKTGSTALMGTLMAASTLPGVLVSPFAGVIIDNIDRKKIFIAMDMIRGAAIVFLTVAAYHGMIALWMVFVAGILLSICGAVFNPGIQAAVPDIVPKTKISNALSVFSILSTGSNMVGNIAGGFLYQALGAPLLFLWNGVSFLFSGSSLFFVHFPSIKKNDKIHFFADMADGFQYMWHQKGLRIILFIAALSNFFSFTAIVLFLPFCKYAPNLGAGKYGILMACFMGGAAAGFVCMSVVNVKAAEKFRVFVAAGILYSGVIITAFAQPFFSVMAALLALSGFFNSVFNVLLISTVQIATPREVKGKVMSFLMMITQGLTPFAMALGGVLGDLLPIRLVIVFSFTATALVSLPAYFSGSFKSYLSTDYSTISPIPSVYIEEQ